MLKVKVPQVHLGLDTWKLRRGDQVTAVKHLDQHAASVRPGTVGIVFELADGTLGPLVAWETGTICNVYPGDVAYTVYVRPSLAEVAEAALLDDAGLVDSTCGCCAAKRALVELLKGANIIE